MTTSFQILGGVKFFKFFLLLDFFFTTLFPKENLKIFFLFFSTTPQMKRRKSHLINNSTHLLALIFACPKTSLNLLWEKKLEEKIQNICSFFRFSNPMFFERDGYSLHNYGLYLIWFLWVLLDILFFKSSLSLNTWTFSSPTRFKN